MWRKCFLAAAGLVLLAGILLTLSVFSIRSGLQRYSHEAMTRFPGDRAEALIQLADCSHCPVDHRNHSVWALGQMAEPRALPVLRKHYDGGRCSHETRLCQHELRKAIRMIETSTWHRPWRD
jgi:hypothetical protein